MKKIIILLLKLCFNNVIYDKIVLKNKVRKDI